MAHSEHSDIDHFNWYDHLDAPHDNWSNHTDAAHADVSHLDWNNHVDQAHYDFTNTYHGDSPEKWTHDDFGNHGDGAHVDWRDHDDEPHVDWSAHGDSPAGAHSDSPTGAHSDHSDWFTHYNWYDHGDWSDHSNWNDHGDSPHWNWSEHFDSPHEDAPLHNNFNQFVSPHSDFWNTTHTDQHVDHRDHDDEPHTDQGHQDWRNHYDATHDDFSNHANVPHGDWSNVWNDAPAPPPPPTVTLQADKTSGYAPLTVNFTVSWTGGASPFLVEIDFGDGRRASETTSLNSMPFTHRYDSPGAYTAVAKVTDGQGRVGQASVTIAVQAPPSPAPEIVRFEVKQIADLQVEAYVEWTGGEYPVVVKIGWGDGVVDQHTVTNPNVRSISMTHTYKNYGKYVVTAVVVDNLGRTSPGKQVEVVVQPEIAIVSWKIEVIGDCHIRSRIEFNVEIKSFKLKWGDGGETIGYPTPPSKVITEERKYSAAGVYHLDISVTDIYDRTAEFGRDVVVPGTIASETITFDPNVVAVIGSIIPVGGSAAITVKLLESGEVLVQVIDAATGRIVESITTDVIKGWPNLWTSIAPKLKDAALQAGATIEEWQVAAGRVSMAVHDAAGYASTIDDAVAAGDNAALSSAGRSLASSIAGFFRNLASTIRDYLAYGAGALAAALKSLASALGISGTVAAMIFGAAAAFIITIVIWQISVGDFKMHIKIVNNTGEEVKALITLYVDEGIMPNGSISAAVYPEAARVTFSVGPFHIFNGVERSMPFVDLWRDVEFTLKPGENTLIFPSNTWGMVKTGKHTFKVVVKALGKEFVGEKTADIPPALRW